MYYPDLQYNKHTYSAPTTSFSRIAYSIVYTHNINININVNTSNNIIYVTHIEREHHVRHAETLFLFFSCSFGVLVSSSKYIILV